MAKNTREGAHETFRLIQAEIVSKILIDGWDKVTYTSIAQELNVTRACIQGHFPSTQSIAEGVQHIVLRYLDNALQKDNFWTGIQLLMQENTKALNAIKMLLTLHLTTGNRTLLGFIKKNTKSGHHELMGIIFNNINEESLVEVDDD